MPHGGVAQLGEHLVCNQKVSGSTPLISIVFNGGTQSPAEAAFFDNCIERVNR